MNDWFLSLETLAVFAGGQRPRVLRGGDGVAVAATVVTCAYLT